MAIKLTFSALLLFVLVFVVTKSVNISNLSQVLLSFPRFKLLELLFISFLITILKAFRFKMLLSSNKIKLNYWDNLKAFIASQAMSPLPGGEFMRGFLVKKEAGSKMSESFGPVVAQAYSELMAASIVAIIGSFSLSILRVPSSVLLVVLLVLGFLLLHRKVFLKFINIFPKFLESKLEMFIKFQKEFEDTIKSDRGLVPNRNFIASLTLAVLTNFLGGFLIYMIAGSYQVDLNFLQSIFLYSMSIVITIIGSVSPGGVGLTEGGLTGLLLLFGVEITKALATVLIFRLITLIFTIILGLIFLALFYSKDLLFTGKRLT